MFTLEKYIEFTETTAIYPNSDKDYLYPLLGLLEESGEIPGKFKKIIRDSKPQPNETEKISKIAYSNYFSPMILLNDSIYYDYTMYIEPLNEKIDSIKKEIGDVYWYLSRLSKLIIMKDLKQDRNFDTLAVINKIIENGDNLNKEKKPDVIMASLKSIILYNSVNSLAEAIYMQDNSRMRSKLIEVFNSLYLLQSTLGIKTSEILELNVSKLLDRKDRNVLNGSGDNR